MNMNELRERRDLWPIIEERLADAIENAHGDIDAILQRADLMKHLERKFRKGEAEHDRDWLECEDPNTLIIDAAEEILDFVIYQAMYVALLEARSNSNE